jgi:hypothetical protein
VCAAGEINCPFYLVRTHIYNIVILGQTTGRNARKLLYINIYREIKREGHGVGNPAIAAAVQRQWSLRRVDGVELILIYSGPIVFNKTPPSNSFWQPPSHRLATAFRYFIIIVGINFVVYGRGHCTTFADGFSVHSQQRRVAVANDWQSLASYLDGRTWLEDAYGNSEMSVINEIL